VSAWLGRMSARSGSCKNDYAASGLNQWRLFGKEERSSGIEDVNGVLALLFRKVFWEMTLLKLVDLALHRRLHCLAKLDDLRQGWWT